MKFGDTVIVCICKVDRRGMRSQLIKQSTIHYAVMATHLLMSHTIYNYNVNALSLVALKRV